MVKCDFSGWATKFNTKCSDGRTITSEAFKHMDGMEVPLLWNHQHTGVENVLGKALLEHRDGEGVYAYCSLNDSDSGKAARQIVNNGDVTHLSIWANNLKEHMKSVLHGNIREVSLVLAGANPGAVIENVAIMHGEEMYEYENEAIIYTNEPFELYHSDSNDEEENGDEIENKEGEEPVLENNNTNVEEVKDVEDPEIKHAESETAKKEEKAADTEEKEETIADVFNTFNEKQKKVVYAMIGQALKDKKGDENKNVDDNKEVKHADDGDDDSDETIADVLNTLSEKQKKVVYVMIAQALEDGKKETKNNGNSEGGNNNMKHNLFEGQDETTVEGTATVLSHSEISAIFEDAKRTGSLKEAILAHGIDDIDVMFPDAKNVNVTPEFIKRDDSWVNEVLNGVHHTPFARIKSIAADITGADARARGYVKGNLKTEEVIRMLKRVTNPTTIYKKQKLDRDDLIDITDFDTVAWLKAEMRMMLNEEAARAYLVGDGRNIEDDPDKIDEECIRPIWTDEDLYTVKADVNVAANATAEDKAKAFIKACVKSRKNYKGSGSPVMYMSEEMLTDCLLIEDVNGRRIYESIEKLAAALCVKKIVPVTVMDGLTRTDKGGATRALAGIYVNLKDYTVGTNKGGAIGMFDDFDIDYNQYKYLMETRCSGALTKPYAAVALEFVTSEAQG